MVVRHSYLFSSNDYDSHFFIFPATICFSLAPPVMSLSVRFDDLLHESLASGTIAGSGGLSFIRIILPPRR